MKEEKLEERENWDCYAFMGSEPAAKSLRNRSPESGRNLCCRNWILFSSTPLFHVRENPMLREFLTLHIMSGSSSIRSTFQFLPFCLIIFLLFNYLYFPWFLAVLLILYFFLNGFFCCWMNSGIYRIWELWWVSCLHRGLYDQEWAIWWSSWLFTGMFVFS